MRNVALYLYCSTPDCLETIHGTIECDWRDTRTGPDQILQDSDHLLGRLSDEATEMGWGTRDQKWYCKTCSSKIARGLKAVKAAIEMFSLKGEPEEN